MNQSRAKQRANGSVSTGGWRPRDLAGCPTLSAATSRKTPSSVSCAPLTSRRHQRTLISASSVVVGRMMWDTFRQQWTCLTPEAGQSSRMKARGSGSLTLGSIASRQTPPCAASIRCACYMATPSTFQRGPHGILSSAASLSSATLSTSSCQTMARPGVASWKQRSQQCVGRRCVGRRSGLRNGHHHFYDLLVARCKCAAVCALTIRSSSSVFDGGQD